MSSATSTPINFNSRSKRWGELSNFYPCMLLRDGELVLTTVEHEYQALKFEIAFVDKEYANLVRAAPTAKEAKSMGSKKAWVNYMKKHGDKSMRSLPKTKIEKLFAINIQRWIAHSVPTMKKLLEVKFSAQHNSKIHQVLVSTGDAPLHEFGRGKGFWIKSGQDMLGKLLVAIREQNFWSKSGQDILVTIREQNETNVAVAATEQESN